MSSNERILEGTMIYNNFEGGFGDLYRTMERNIY